MLCCYFRVCKVINFLFLLLTWVVLKYNNYSSIFHDSFFLNNEVKRYNERKLKDEEDKKYKNAKLISSSRIVPFSLARFVSSILYGIWLGALCWMAGSVTFGRTAQDSLAMTSAMAAAVTAASQVGSVEVISYYGLSKLQNSSFFLILIKFICKEFWIICSIRTSPTDLLITITVPLLYYIIVNDILAV
uniref:ABC transmembrane type-1 domain-containing protein n=1 Tax=Heterorhabditis bacteriophora TaxID=37862 RepID=A0A1I7WL11_HETBA